MEVLCEENLIIARSMIKILLWAVALVVRDIASSSLVQLTVLRSDEPPP